ncbi:MAG: peptidoglycan DD-metalloendopeptidase family protein [Burkholderiaceae bacterium]|jgi:lipoprotein NlpD|nr:peptidoglycan DD-metalloendopeptidase family protein [Burkholderiaceae bacterium]
MLLCRRFRHATLSLGLLPGAVLVVAALLAGCGSNPNRPPVQDLAAALPASPPPPPPPSAGNPESAGIPAYHTVKPGETVRRIAVANGQDWRNIVRWNKLHDPNKIEVGQVLRVVPPGSTGPIAAVIPSAGGATSVAVATQIEPCVAGSPDASQPLALAGGGADNMGFIWPTKGAVLTGFDDDKNKGIDISGKTGDPVYAAADGRVVYAGSGLAGYGNLVILKHNNTYLTAYAHNRSVLVKEDQNVRKGQKIAEMGSSDADRVMLHFEIRRSGKPVNPIQYLPAR